MVLVHPIDLKHFYGNSGLSPLCSVDDSVPSLADLLFKQDVVEIDIQARLENSMLYWSLRRNFESRYVKLRLFNFTLKKRFSRLTFLVLDFLLLDELILHSIMLLLKLKVLLFQHFRLISTSL